MSSREDLTGQRFSRLVAVSLEPGTTRAGRARWLCQCDCGRTCVVDALSLKQSNTRSCGCLHRKRSSSSTRTFHGLTKTRAYQQWKAMRRRCQNENSSSFPRYGGRGIKVHPRWDDYLPFLEDMGPCPPKHTIERINNDGDYEPGNCRWATRYEQARNRSDNVRVASGRIVADEARLNGIKPSIVYNRVNQYGWPLEEAVKTPSLGVGRHR